MAKDPGSDRHQEMCAWLTKNGIPLKLVPARDGDLTIRTEPDGSRVIVYEAFVLTEDGMKQLDERRDRIAMEIRTTPLLVEPPEWWEPYQKPTRDQLLAVVDRVRTLHRRNEHTGDCEHCSKHDYPDYAVSWPCATVQALT